MFARWVAALLLFTALISAREHALRHASLYLWGLFIAFWYVPAVGGTFWGLLNLITDGLNIDSDLIWAGWRELRFWKRM